MKSVTERLLIITDLLLGAAYSDKKLRGEEEQTVRKLLSRMIAGRALPKEVEARIESFPVETFSLEKAAVDFAKDPPIQKRKLLELVAHIHEADGEIDIEEDAYLRSLGAALGMKESEYKDLVLEYEEVEEHLRASLLELVGPPPVPEKI